MDPNETLREMTALARAWIDDAPSRDSAIRMAELVMALDAWIRTGGFLPSAWTLGQMTTKSE